MEVPLKTENRTTNDSAILLLGIFPKKIKTLTRKVTCTLMFTAALFTIARYGSNLSVHQWMNEYRKGSIYTKWNIIQP